MTTPAAGKEQVVPALTARTRRSDYTLDAGTEYRVGRDSSADIPLDDNRVSWRHAVLRAENGAWILEDSGSTNGTFHNSERITRLPITRSLLIRFGNPEDGPLLRLEPQAAPPPPAPPDPQPRVRPSFDPFSTLPSVDRRPSLVMPLAQPVMRIGRTPDNDLEVPDLAVSRHHAELRKTPTGTYQIVDLGSHNGTFLNGAKVEKAEISETDIVSIGPATFRLADGQLREYVDTGDVTFSAQGLTVRVGGGKVLLDNVTFPVPERCFVGVIGPSGAGKSTLLNALTGMRPADAGSVLYDNRDLYRHYPELRHRIGLVPQEEILHTQLTARRSLTYTAELRFPPDTGKRDREHRVTEVLGELGLAQHAETRADALSGGQRKRVSVALELLTRPSMLFLDEPTSGLDPGREKALMEQMRDLAHDGRTIFVVTHSVLNLDTCDRLLVLVPGGKIAYYGPPDEGLRYFGQTRWDVVFEEFERQPDRDWAGEFQRSADYAQYVARPLGLPPRQPHPGPPTPRGVAPAAVPDPRPVRRRGAVSQLSTLARRYLRVIASDRFFLGTLIVIPLLLGGVVRLIPADHGISAAMLPAPNPEGQTLLMVLMIMAALAGIVNSAREFVKERPIYVRERAAGLAAGPYLLSKTLVLGVICVLQAVVMTLIGLYGRPLPSSGSLLTHQPLTELILALAALEFSSMCLGLLLSAVLSSSDKAMQAIVAATMVQFVFSGALFQLNGKLVLNQLSWLFPARWGMAALASTAQLNRIDPAMMGKPDGLWNHAAGTWELDFALTLIIGVAFLLIAWRRLMRLGPTRRK